MTNYDDAFEYEEGEFAELDAFIEHLSYLQDEHDKTAKIQMIDPKRQKQFNDALYTLTRIARKTTPDAKIEYTLNDELNIGAANITIETDEFATKDMEQFASSIKHASNIEFYPLANGNIKICAMFYNMFVDATS